MSSQINNIYDIITNSQNKLPDKSPEEIAQILFDFGSEIDSNDKSNSIDISETISKKDLKEQMRSMFNGSDEDFEKGFEVFFTVFDKTGDGYMDTSELTLFDGNNKKDTEINADTLSKSLTSAEIKELALDSASETEDTSFSSNIIPPNSITRSSAFSYTIPTSSVSTSSNTGASSNTSSSSSSSTSSNNITRSNAISSFAIPTVTVSNKTEDVKEEETESESTEAKAENTGTENTPSNPAYSFRVNTTSFTGTSSNQVISPSNITSSSSASNFEIPTVTVSNKTEETTEAETEEETTPEAETEEETTPEAETEEEKITEAETEEEKITEAETEEVETEAETEEEKITEAETEEVEVVTDKKAQEAIEFLEEISNNLNELNDEDKDLKETDYYKQQEATYIDKLITEISNPEISPEGKVAIFEKAVNDQKDLVLKSLEDNPEKAIPALVDAFNDIATNGTIDNVEQFINTYNSLEFIDSDYSFLSAMKEMSWCIDMPDLTTDISKKMELIESIGNLYKKAETKEDINRITIILNMPDMLYLCNESSYQIAPLFQAFIESNVLPKEDEAYSEITNNVKSAYWNEYQNEEIISITSDYNNGKINANVFKYLIHKKMEAAGVYDDDKQHNKLQTFLDEEFFCSTQGYYNFTNLMNALTYNIENEEEE